MLAIALAFVVSAPPQSTAFTGPVTAGWQTRHDVATSVEDGFADVVVAGSVAWATGTSAAGDGDLLVVASLVESGAVLWSRTFATAPFVHGAGNVVRLAGPTVVVGGSEGIAGTNVERGLLLGLDAATGATQWTLPFAPPSSPTSGWRTAFVDVEVGAGGHVVYALASSAPPFTPFVTTLVPDMLFAVDRATGGVLWQVATDGVDVANAVALSPDGARIAVVGAKHRDVVGWPFPISFAASCRSTAGGALLWQCELDDAEFLPPPLGARDAVFTPSGDAVVVAGAADEFQLHALATAGGGTLWSHGEPALALDRVSLAPDGRGVAVGAVGGEGNVTGFDATTGTVPWVASGFPASQATDLELLGDGRCAIAFRQADSTEWHLELRDVATGSLVGSELLPATSGAHEARALAVDPLVPGLVAAGTRHATEHLGRAVLRRYALGGAFLGETLHDEQRPADQTVTAAATGADGAVVYTAGAGGWLEPPSTATTAGWVAAHRSSDGATLWSRTLGADGTLTGGVRSLAVDPAGARVFAGGHVGSNAARVVALDATDGTTVWTATFDAAAAIDGVVDLDVVAGGPVVVATAASTIDSALLGLDAATGAVLWSHATGSVGFVRPLGLLSADGARAYLVTGTLGTAGSQTDVRVACVDVASGALAWSNTYDWSGAQEAWDADWPADGVLTPDGAALFVVGGTESGPSLADGTVWTRIDAHTGAVDWHALVPYGTVENVYPRRLVLDGDAGTLYTLISRRHGIFPPTYELVVRSLDATTGQLGWSIALPTGTQDVFNGHALTLRPDGSALVLASAFGGAWPDAHGVVAGLDTATGAPQWSAVLQGAGPIDESSRALVVLPDGMRVVSASQSSLDASHRDLVLQELRLPGLTGSPQSLSLASGGVQAFSLSGGAAEAGHVALLVGSASGTSPAFPLTPTLAVPLVVDGYALFTVAHPNTPPLTGSLAALDAKGHASASFTLPAGLSPALAGTTLHHAWLGFDAFGATFVSNAVPLAFVP